MKFASANFFRISWKHIGFITNPSGGTPPSAFLFLHGRARIRGSEVSIQYSVIRLLLITDR